MKISDFRGEAALDMVAELIEPATEIMSDPETKKTYDESTLSCVRYVLKNHKKEIIHILATLDGVPVEKYNKNIPEMVSSVLEIVGDPDLRALFGSAPRLMAVTASGAHTENTEASES